LEDVHAQFLPGTMYENEKGVTQDYSEAMKVSAEPQGLQMSRGFLDELV
jgi:TPR repeat protein